MGVWGVGQPNQSQPKYVIRSRAQCPLQHRPPPNPTQTGWVFAVGLQKPANLVAFGEGWMAPDKARVLAPV